jgi:magnesium chelatase subunit D
MKPAVYPFSAIAGQHEMKLALLLAAVDWRISVLLRGDKGAGKTTSARALAALLPAHAPFVNLPIGSTEDRLLGGLHLERTLKGDPVLKPGLLSEAHRGVLYIDEINLLPAHLGDALLDAAASGVNVVEREGLSASHAAEFVLLGSMNPEEGLLRPQLLDRFALCVDVTASLDPQERQTVVERRIAFERDPILFSGDWSEEQRKLRDRISSARERLNSIVCSSEIFVRISAAICDKRVRSLRADLAAMRAAMAYAALAGEDSVQPHHVETVLPLVLAHRAHRSTDRARSPSSSAPPQPPSPSENTAQEAQEAMERIFAPRTVETPAIHPGMQATSGEQLMRGVSASAPAGNPGSVAGSRRTENPVGVDLRATLNHALLETGAIQPRVCDLHEKVRNPKAGTRYLFVIDSSGSHAAQERMGLVKGAAASLLARFFKKDDEVAMIAFRGAAAQVLLEPTRAMNEATTALEYLPTGGRTPLAHGLDLARAYITPSTLLILLTDGRANVALRMEDPWQEALEIASQLHCPALVIDTENAAQPLGRSRKLAGALRARYVALENLEDSDDLMIELQRPPSAP